MSASLVGSEMCIRDRSSLSGGATADPDPPEKRGGTSRGGSRGAVPPPESCLLYTSDAADDM
eukprot:2418537-Alexandrium_andersonii.AAC.1